MRSYVVNFIRHGLTEANVKGQYAGSTDVPVCAEGMEKLNSLKENYPYPRVDAYYSSPMTRCKQTCKIIYPEANPIIIDDLRECDFGEWEGKTPGELEGNEYYKEWLNGGRLGRPPKGESGMEFKNRIDAAVEGLIEDLMRKGIFTAAVFAHGGVIMQVLSTYGLPKVDPFDLMVDNGCGYSVRITPGIWMRGKTFEICERIPGGLKSNLKGKFKELIDAQRKGVEKE